MDGMEPATNKRQTNKISKNCKQFFNHSSYFRYEIPQLTFPFVINIHTHTTYTPQHTLAQLSSLHNEYKMRNQKQNERK